MENIALQAPDTAQAFTFDAEALAPKAVLIVGAGQNTKHMSKSLGRLAEHHPLHVAEVTEPQIPVDEDKLHLVNTPEGQASLQELIGRGVVRAAYGSLIPPLHVGFLQEYLGHVGSGNIDFVVISKPAVQNRAELRLVDAAKKDAEAQLRSRHGEAYDPAENPILFVHEHYIEKGAWAAFRREIGEISKRLGRLEFATVDIEEARTAEQEGRVAAFGGGALEDFGPHVISLGRDVQHSINNDTDGRYTIPDHSTTEVKRFRYHNSDLPKGVETGFIVDGQTIITDNETGSQHALHYVWRGGKGLVDKKEAALTFVHPETGNRSTVTVDLKNNRLEVPPSVQDLFPTTEFDDNGYGYVVEVGLNGGDPRKSFQPWDEARIVTIWGESLARQGKANGEPILHPIGMSLAALHNGNNFEKNVLDQAA